MRLNGVEPSRVFPPTRPSTLRVYQFRHSRSRARDSRCLRAGEAAGCGCPEGQVLYEQVFEGNSRLFNPGSPGVEEAGTTMELDLTKRQKEIFDFIRKYAAKTGYPPTVREIGK